MDKALKYNRKRGYSSSEINSIAVAVRAPALGRWTEDLVQAVKDWQDSRALKADGMVGPRTYEEIKLAHVGSADGDTAVGCGLAAYDQSFPGHRPEEALTKALDAALNLGCKTIRFWSSEWLIPKSEKHGGNKGNSYSGEWLRSVEIPDDVKIGCWIDDPLRDVKSPEFAKAIADMGITEGAVMINKSNAYPGSVPWDLRWEEDDIKRVADNLRQHGIRPIATCWPLPSRKQIHAMCDDLEWILEAFGTKTIEVDTEANWKKSRLAGFEGMDQASRYLAESMRALVGDSGTLGLTTYTFHRENSNKALLAPLMDMLLPQAYSVRHRSHDAVEWNSQLGPGRHQELAIRRARSAGR